MPRREVVFSGARPAGEEHHLPLGGGFHRLHLQGGVGETLFPLNSGPGARPGPLGGQSGSPSISSKALAT